MMGGHHAERTHQTGAFEAAVSGLFDTATGSSLPADLSPYYAVVINDRPARNINGVDRIADFLRDEKGGKQGNGLVVVGGFNSYDRGGYLNSQFESLLPVKVGKPKRELGDNNLVFVIQVSGSTGGSKFVASGGGLTEIKEDVPVVNIIKAQAVSAIENLNLQIFFSRQNFKINSGMITGKIFRLNRRSSRVYFYSERLFVNTSSIIFKRGG